MSIRYFAKPSYIIHIEHKFSLIEHQLLNLLLAHFKYTGTSCIMLSELQTYCKTRNRKFIYQALERIATIAICNMITKDRNTKLWGQFTILESVHIEKGACFYTVNQDLVNLLHTKSVFGIINLDIQRLFKSKYSAFLYELCIDYASINTTPRLSIEEFRRYMGLQESNYKTFKALNSLVIKKALSEVNTKSDITLEARYSYEGKKVTHIQLGIRKKTVLRSESKKSISDADQDLVKKLTECGLSMYTIKHLVKSYSREKIIEKYTLLHKQKNITNKAGWLISALKNNWSFDTSNAKDFLIANKINKQKTELKTLSYNKRAELEREHSRYIIEKRNRAYNNLSEQEKSMLEEKYQEALQLQPAIVIQAGLEKMFKQIFLTQQLVDCKEQNFLNWIEMQGYASEELEKTNNKQMSCTAIKKPRNLHE